MKKQQNGTMLPQTSILNILQLCIIKDMPQQNFIVILIHQRICRNTKKHQNVTMLPQTQTPNVTKLCRKKEDAYRDFRKMRKPYNASMLAQSSILNTLKSYCQKVSSQLIYF